MHVEVEIYLFILSSVAEIHALESNPLADLYGSGRVSSSLPWWSPAPTLDFLDGSES
jgi:hypothetical protein